jgi:HD-like signal output (HDOD) protein/CheY-like chemotaxis protein
MVCVLFVDEDAANLDGLRKMCSESCQDWQPTFARGGAAALAMMEGRAFDVVVSGSRLVDMEGPTFLKRAKQRKPETVRISLTSPGDPGAAMRSLPVAHQCLTKRCSPEVLIRTIERAAELQALLHSGTTRRMLGQVGDLPSLPGNLAALDAALCNEESSLGEVARIVTRDVAMSAKVLQLVNSPFFGLRSSIRDLRQAVAYLGVETLRNLTITTEIFRVFKPGDLLPDDWMERFNGHSLEVADIAGRLVRTSAAQYEASVAGLLHDVGELVVADRAPAKLCAILEEVSSGRLADEAETDHLGATYPVLGGCLLSLWGMNYRVVEAVTRHREHWEGQPRDPELPDAVHVADALASAGRATQPRATRPRSSVGAGSPESGPALSDGNAVDTPATAGETQLPGDAQKAAGPGECDAATRLEVIGAPDAPGDDGLCPSDDGEPEGAHAEVCQPSQLVDLSEEYLENVGLLGAVRLYRAGALSR